MMKTSNDFYHRWSATESGLLRKLAVENFDLVNTGEDVLGLEEQAYLEEAHAVAQFILLNLMDLVIQADADVVR